MVKQGDAHELAPVLPQDPMVRDGLDHASASEELQGEGCEVRERGVRVDGVGSYREGCEEWVDEEQDMLDRQHNTK